MTSADFTIADVLDEARALVERGWCQCRYGENSAGGQVEATSPDAVRWCATGAIERAADRFSREHGASYFTVWQDTTSALDQSLGTFRTCWNDHHTRTQREVVEAFRKAVAELRGAALSDTWTKTDAYLTDIEDVARERVSA